MKKTAEQLKQIIKEELTRILAEEDVPMDREPIDYSALADTEPPDEELYYENLE
jgi:hypothetical protein